MKPAELLSKMSHNIQFEDLPKEVVDRTKYLMLDYIGLAARGSVFESSKPIHEFIKKNGSNGDGVIIGKGEIRTLPQYAALANGSAAHSLELDDVINEASLHPAVVVFPTAYAVGDVNRKTGRQIIEASVAGYEVMGRLGKALNPTHVYDRGFHPTGVVGIFAAAAVASKLMGNSQKQTVSALGIVGSQAAASMEFLKTGAWTKRLHPGWAAHSGMIASELAKFNFIGPETVIEGESGLANSYSYDYNLGEMENDFSYNNNYILKTSIKPHACCRYKQGPLDLVLKIVKENQLMPHDIQKINVHLVKTALPIVAYPEAAKRNPKTPVDGQFSMHFGAAVAAIHQRTLLEEYDQKVVDSSDVREMMQKVYCYHEPQLDKEFPRKWPARVEIETAKGTFSESIEFPKGEPENPLSWEELITKFKYVSAPVYSEERQEEIINAVRNIEKYENIKDISGLF